ncbi:MAG: Ig-like domain-containing protein [Mycobacteriaceae bacterium]|nr:Ig-like domain-containing protein [Mycobacteriaceae bacterium]
MVLPATYADVEDLAGYWRPLSDAEQSRAGVLLGAAADRINEFPGAQNFVQTACKWVSLDMVKRAMIGGGGERSLSQSMADIEVTQQFANPMGELYLTAKEVNRLRGRFGQAAGSVVLSSNVRVPLQPWNFQSSFQASGVDWLTVCPAAVTLGVGGQRQLMVLAATHWEYEDRTDYAQYTTSESTVATVSNDGVVTAIHTGTATITVTYEGLTAQCTVTVS